MSERTIAWDRTNEVLQIVCAFVKNIYQTIDVVEMYVEDVHLRLDNIILSYVLILL